MTRKQRGLLATMTEWAFLNAIASLERRKQPLPQFSQVEFDRLSELRKRVAAGMPR